MIIKKITMFVSMYIFITFFTVYAQDANVVIMSQFQMSENIQDAISRFPRHLHNGFQEAYTSLINFQNISDDEALSIFNMFLMINFMKTNIILAGSGNDRFENTEFNYLQQYSQLRVAAIEAFEGIKFVMIESRRNVIRGDIFGRLISSDIDDWGNRFLRWL
jgi:hypothetical protein